MRMNRIVIASLSIVALCASWPALAQQKIKLQVAGNLLATGLIQKNKEQPFFETLAQTTGLPIDVDYKPMDTTGIKDIEGLRVLRNGLFDIVTLRVAQVSRDEPFLLGLDIVGLATDYEIARKITASYRDAFNARLEQRYNAKLLGLWPFGPAGLVLQAGDKGARGPEGKEGPRLRPVAGQIHRKAGWRAGHHFVRGDPTGAEPRGRRVRDYRPEFGQFRRLA